MTTRISMISLNKLSKARNEKNKDTDHDTALYEAGMIEVLKQISLSKSTILDQFVPKSNLYRDVVVELDILRKKLIATLSKENFDLLDQIESTESLLSYLEREEVFTLGFIEGYRFMRQIHESFNPS